MFEGTKPTKSERTQQAYRSRFESLKRRFCREAGVSDLDPDEVVAKLIMVKETLTMSSWRQYKAATLHYLYEFAPGHDVAIDILSQESSVGLRRTSNRTSGRKAKEVPAPTWASIQNELLQRSKRGLKHSEGLLHVLKATLLTGLRPNEWSFSERGTHAATGRAVLRVRNSKHSNGRANGEYRELFIDELTPEEIASIDAALAFCKADSDEDGAKIVEALRNEFKTAARRHPAWRSRKGSVSLYSFRHQFIADAKLTFEDPVMIAAVVGHNSTATAFEHYGRRRDGRGKVRVFPTPESIQAVQNVQLETYLEFIEARRQSGARPQ